MAEEGIVYEHSKLDITVVLYIQNQCVSFFTSLY